MVNIRKLTAGVLATTKAVWKGGSPFAALTAMWPTNEEGKYTIESEGIKIAFTNHGAAVSNLWIKDKNGEELDIVLGLDHADMYVETDSNPYLNGIIGKYICFLAKHRELTARHEGRYAGYISGASYEADGVVQKITANAYNGAAVFNGGEKGWGRLDWAIPSKTETDTITFVMFDRGNNGFPGLFVGCVTHTVSPYEWHIQYGVTPLLMPGGPLNMAQQVFFNLDGLRTVNGTIGSIVDHKLHLPMSGMRFAFDDYGIPTGNILSNKKGDGHDFWSSPKHMEAVISQNQAPSDSPYDETFMIAHKYADYSRRDRPVAVLSSENSGITMEVYTDQDALRVHTWNSEVNGQSRFFPTVGIGI